MGTLEQNDLVFDVDRRRRLLTECRCSNKLPLLLETFIKFAVNLMMSVLRQLALGVEDEPHQFVALGVQVQKFAPSLAAFGGATHSRPSS